MLGRCCSVVVFLLLALNPLASAEFSLTDSLNHGIVMLQTDASSKKAFEDTSDTAQTLAVAEDPVADTKSSTHSSKHGSKQATNKKEDRFTWIHIPKCGTSFANTLITWGCPRIDSQDLITDDDVGQGQGTVEWMETNQDKCDTSQINISCGHRPIGQGAGDCSLSDKGSYVSMFRQPEQRILSAYYFGMGSKGHKPPEYAKMYAGCTVRMLTGRECSRDKPTPTTDEDAQLAVERLSNFSFVGLTEEWGLSVCLFHTMFGGACHARELNDIRPGARHHKDGYDTSKLDGFVDKHDGMVYQAVSDIFWRRIAHHGLSLEKCHSCLKATH